jgi:hypothetical protein
MTMTGSIFLCYRRSDNDYAVDSLYERLESHFGAGAVHRDIHVKGGIKWREELRQRIESSNVVLAVIGRDWFPEGRAKAGSDEVVKELLLAKARAIPIVPVLLAGIAPPKREDLPKSLRFLADNQARYWRSGRDRERDFEDLCADIDHHFSEARASTGRDRTAHRSSKSQAAAAGPAGDSGRRAWMLGIGMLVALALGVVLLRVALDDELPAILLDAGAGSLVPSSTAPTARLRSVNPAAPVEPRWVRVPRTLRSSATNSPAPAGAQGAELLPPSAFKRSIGADADAPGVESSTQVGNCVSAGIGGACVATPGWAGAAPSCDALGLFVAGCEFDAATRQCKASFGTRVRRCP